MIFVNDHDVPVSFWLDSRMEVAPGATLDVSPAEGAAILAMGVRLRHVDLAALVAAQVAPAAPSAEVSPEGEAPAADDATDSPASPRRRRG